MAPSSGTVGPQYWYRWITTLAPLDPHIGTGGSQHWNRWLPILAPLDLHIGTVRYAHWYLWISTSTPLTPSSGTVGPQYWYRSIPTLAPLDLHIGTAEPQNWHRWISTLHRWILTLAPLGLNMDTAGPQHRHKAQDILFRLAKHFTDMITLVMGHPPPRQPGTDQDASFPINMQQMLAPCEIRGVLRLVEAERLFCIWCVTWCRRDPLSLTGSLHRTFPF